MPQTPRFHRIAWLAVSCIFLLSCGGPPVSNSSQTAQPEKRTLGKPGGTLTYRLTSPPKTLNYLLADDEASLITAFFLLNSRLIEFDHEAQKYGPGLAESWTTNGQTVDIKLRDGLKFSDGDPLTTDDVIFSLKAIYDEKTNSPVFRDAMMVNGKPIEARKVDDLNLQLIFPDQVAAVENYLDNLSILPMHTLQPAYDAGTLAEAWKVDADPKSIVASGPFTVESSTPGERIILKRNPNYWKKDASGVQLPYLEKLAIEIVSDPNNALGGLNQGSLDMADRIRPSDLAALNAPSSAARGYDIGPGLGTDHIWFNLNPATETGENRTNSPKFGWFNNKLFRQAVSSAIDRDSIASVTLQELATPLYGFVAPANRAWVNQNLPKTPHDLAKSRELLKQAGFEQRGTADAPELFDAQNNRVEFTLLVPMENEPRKLMAAVIQEDLNKLGIKMQVVPIEVSAITKRWTKSFDYDAILFGLGVTGIVPTTYANFILSNGDVHQWHPNQKSPATQWEAKIDTLFAEQGRETDPQKRAAIFNEIQSIIAEEVPIIPIASRHVVSAANPRIGNFSPSTMLPYSLWNVDEIFIKQ